jgi:RNA polymerase sigma factor (sigma-70 family)
MANAQPTLLLRHLRRVIGAESTAVTDAQLLERFVSLRDEAAFELLVWRHERMVLGVCRRVLRGEQDVEDACQATFLALARKAGAIARREALAGWLYRVAYRCALRARAHSAKQPWQALPRSAWLPDVTATANPAAEAERHDCRRVLDEEVSRLPAKYREGDRRKHDSGPSNQARARADGPVSGGRGGPSDAKMVIWPSW